MRMSRWLYIANDQSLSLALPIATWSALHVAVASEYDPGRTNLVRHPNVSSEPHRTILPVGHSVGVAAVAFASDGTLIAGGNVDNLACLWHTQAGKVWRTLVGHRSGVTSVAFSPNGQSIASDSRDTTIRLWDVAIRSTIRNLTGHTEHVSSVAFSHDRNHLTNGRRDTMVGLWEIDTGPSVLTLIGIKGGVTSVAFAPDGGSLAACSEDNSVRVWDVRTATILRTLANLGWESLHSVFAGRETITQRRDYGLKHGRIQTRQSVDKHHIIAVATEKSPETLLS